jgi:hypothetical protein
MYFFKGTLNGLITGLSEATTTTSSSDRNKRDESCWISKHKESHHDLEVLP